MALPSVMYKGLNFGGRSGDYDPQSRIRGIECLSSKYRQGVTSLMAKAPVWDAPSPSTLTARLATPRLRSGTPIMGPLSDLSPNVLSSRVPSCGSHFGAFHIRCAKHGSHPAPFYTHMQGVPSRLLHGMCRRELFSNNLKLHWSRSASR